jgi:two-component system cell cycle sensor histidine kinase/response regulator CckA
LPLGRGELVLVVDDEHSIRTIARATLENCGYQVLTAADGTEAVALYAQRQPEIHIVLTDLSMPFLDGLATIRVLQRLNPDVKVILASGTSERTEIPGWAESQTISFLEKPFAADQLLEALQHALHGPATPAKPI